MADLTDAEAEARRQYENAKRTKVGLKEAIEQGYGTRADQLRQLDRLWRHIQDFVPRHWREEERSP